MNDREIILSALDAETAAAFLRLTRLEQEAVLNNIPAGCSAEYYEGVANALLAVHRFLRADAVAVHAAALSKSAAACTIKLLFLLNLLKCNSYTPREAG